MKQWNGRELTRSFSDGIEDDDGGGGDTTDSGPETTEADYSFEGFSVEFIDKVALMPVTLATPLTLQSRRR